MRSFWTCAAVAALSIALTPATRAAELAIPDCNALLGWAKSYHPSRGIEIAPNVTLDNIFANDVTTKVFGKPALEWNANENRAVSNALATCGTQYRKVKDTESVQALTTARTAMGRSLRGAVTHLSRQEQALENARARLLRDPPSPAAYRMLADYDTAEKITERYRNLAGAPEDRLAAIAKEVAAHRAKMRAEAVDKTSEAIKALPQDARSLLAVNRELDQLRTGFDDSPERKDIEAVEAMAKQRGAAIRQTLIAASPGNPPMLFPECDAFLRWAAAVNTQQPLQTGAGYLYNALMDDALVPVFGRPLDAWSDDEVALFREGMQPCLQPTMQDGQRQSPPGAQQARMLANQIPSARNTMSRYKQAKAELAKAEQQIKSAEPTMAGIQALAMLPNTPALAGLDRMERQHLVQAVQVRQRQIAETLMVDSAKKLGEFKGNLADLERIAAYRQQVMMQLGRLVSAKAVQDFETSFRARDAQIAKAALPEFTKELAKLPVDPEAAKAARLSINGLIGPRLMSFQTQPGMRPQQASIPDYFVPYRDRAEERAKQIEAAVHEANCKKAMTGVKLSSRDGRQEVLGPLGPTMLGDVVCRLILTGHTFHSYDAPGMFGGKDHVLKVTVAPQGYQTITLRKGEIAPGKEALVGYSIGDANVTKTMTVQEWQGYAAMLTGQSMQAGMNMLEQMFKGMEQQMR